MSTRELLHFNTVILNSQDLYSIHRSEYGNWLDEDRSSFLYSKMHKSGSPILTVQGALVCGKYQDPPRDLWKKKSITSVGSWRFQKHTRCVTLFLQTTNIHPSWQWWLEDSQRYQYNSARLSGVRMMASYSFYPTQTSKCNLTLHF